MAGEQAGFEKVWPAIAGRLERALRRRRVPEEFIDDVVQETALRLLRNWGSVDQTTLWPLTLTVAGNIIKDDMRRRGRDEQLAASLPELQHVDIEERALARLELSRVHKAFRFLSTTQRNLLLAEVYGSTTVIDLSRGAMKMGRLRARRRLREMLDRASGALTLTGIRLRRLFDADGRGQLAEATSQGIAAAALVAAGVDLLIAGGGAASTIDRLTQPPKQILQVGHMSSEPGHRPSEVLARSSEVTTTGSAARANSAGTASGRQRPSEAILDHGEKVGPNGASVWGKGSILNHGVQASATVEQKPARCNNEGISLGRSMICAGKHLTVRARVGYNGWSHTFEVSTDVGRGVRTD